MVVCVLQIVNYNFSCFSGFVCVCVCVLTAWRHVSSPPLSKQGNSAPPANELSGFRNDNQRQSQPNAKFLVFFLSLRSKFSTGEDLAI